MRTCLLAICAIAVSPLADARGLSRVSPQARDTANLIVTVLDPFGQPAADVPLLLENGAFQIPFVVEGVTDRQGRFRVRVPAGRYNLSAPVEFFPGTEISIGIGQAVQRTIRMALHETSAAFTVCIDCTDAKSSAPSAELVEEFRSDRDAPLSALASGAEPEVGWEFYQPSVPDSLRRMSPAPSGRVIVAGYVQATERCATCASSPPLTLRSARPRSMRCVNCAGGRRVFAGEPSKSRCASLSSTSATCLEISNFRLKAEATCTTTMVFL